MATESSLKNNNRMDSFEWFYSFVALSLKTLHPSDAALAAEHSLMFVEVCGEKGGYQRRHCIQTIGPCSQNITD